MKPAALLGTTLSRNLGISSTVNQWTTGIRQIPAERCPEIESLLVVLSPAKSFVLTLTGPKRYSNAKA